MMMDTQATLLLMMTMTHYCWLYWLNSSSFFTTTTHCALKSLKKYVSSTDHTHTCNTGVVTLDHTNTISTLQSAHAHLHLCLISLLTRQHEFHSLAWRSGEELSGSSSKPRRGWKWRQQFSGHQSKEHTTEWRLLFQQQPAYDMFLGVLLGWIQVICTVYRSYCDIKCRGGGVSNCLPIVVVLHRIQNQAWYKGIEEGWRISLCSCLLLLDSYYLQLEAWHCMLMWILLVLVLLQRDRTVAAPMSPCIAGTV